MLLIERFVLSIRYLDMDRFVYSSVGGYALFFVVWRTKKRLYIIDIPYCTWISTHIKNVDGKGLWIVKFQKILQYCNTVYIQRQHASTIFEVWPKSTHPTQNTKLIVHIVSLLLLLIRTVYYYRYENKISEWVSITVYSFYNE